jgi:hypothetical protein
VTLSAFTASDSGSGVAGYCITETNSPAGCSWTTTQPTQVTVSAEGSFTFYGWARDATGNISSAITASTIVAVPRGDVDNSGSNGIADALLALRAVSGLTTLSIDQRLRADVAPRDVNGAPKGNGILDHYDVIGLLRLAVGL